MVPGMSKNDLEENKIFVSGNFFSCVELIFRLFYFLVVKKCVFLPCYDLFFVTFSDRVGHFGGGTTFYGMANFDRFEVFPMPST